MRIGDRVQVLNPKSQWFGEFGTLVRISRVTSDIFVYRVALDNYPTINPIFKKESLILTRPELLTDEEFERIKELNDDKNR